MPLPIDTKLKFKELELKSLFETIRAINANASEKDLYKIFTFIIRSNPNISKLALYVLDEEWNCKSHYGTQHNFSQLPLDEAILEVKEVSGETANIPYFEEFARIVPVKHKTTVLAYVLLSGVTGTEDEDVLELDFIEALSNIIIVAIENKKLARREQKQQEYKKQLDIAKDVQSLLFPKALPFEKRLTIEASYLPHHTIGGDYYDLIQIDAHKFLCCIADVSGKGIPAAILMSNFQAALRILSRHTNDLEHIVTELNHLVIQNSNGENFITAFFGLYNFETSELKYVNAGHNPPYLFQGDEINRLETGTTVLGGFHELPMLDIGMVRDLKVFTLFCFTDGFIETYDESGEEFGEEKLEHFLKEYIDIDQKELHQKLIAVLNQYKGENSYFDDITLLSCKVNGELSTPN